MRKGGNMLGGIAVLLVVGVLGALTIKFFGETNFTQPIVISAFNTKGLDWVELKNETDKIYSTDGLVLSDGDNTFPIPVMDIQAKKTITLASAEAKGKLDKNVDAYWAEGDPDPWGFREDEIILVYDSKDLLILDFRFPSEQKKTPPKGVYKPSDIKSSLVTLGYVNAIWDILILLVGAILSSFLNIVIKFVGIHTNPG